MRNIPFIILLLSYILAAFSFTVYSYSQIDLNLTLSSNLVYQELQHQLIYLGYFNRPASGLYFIGILTVLFFLYVSAFALARKKKLKVPQVTRIIILVSLIFLFAYPAFSHDIFNYIFDARIVTSYHLNPYQYKALDFPDDLWVRFMHWTHRTYPYGPIWLLTTLPFSFIGAGKFVPTLFLFKLMFFIFHIGNIWLVYKIVKHVKKEDAASALVFYGLNPLVLIESIVSPHNEVVMLFFLLLSLYVWFIKRSAVWGVVIFFLSVGIKFVTVILAPCFAFILVKRNKPSLQGVSLTVFFLLIVPLILEIWYRESYPWYFLPLLAVGALLVRYVLMEVILIGVSAGALLRYVPYLLTGDYSPETTRMQNGLFFGAIIVSMIWAAVQWRMGRLSMKRI